MANELKQDEKIFVECGFARFVIPMFTAFQSLNRSQSQLSASFVLPPSIRPIFYVCMKTHLLRCSCFEGRKTILIYVIEYQARLLKFVFDLMECGGNMRKKLLVGDGRDFEIAFEVNEILMRDLMLFEGEFLWFFLFEKNFSVNCMLGRSNFSVHIK